MVIDVKEQLHLPNVKILLFWAELSLDFARNRKYFVVGQVFASFQRGFLRSAENAENFMNSSENFLGICKKNKYDCSTGNTSGIIDVKKNYGLQM